MPVRMERKQVPATTVAVENPDRVVLILTMYKNYTMGGKEYKGEVPYSFSRKTAMKLLQEEDCGRLIWKMWSPAPIKKPIRPVVQDRTDVPVPEDGEPIHGIDTTPSRTNVGTDDEIADILGRTDDQEDGQEVNQEEMV